MPGLSLRTQIAPAAKGVLQREDRPQTSSTDDRSSLSDWRAATLWCWPDLTRWRKRYPASRYALTLFGQLSTEGCPSLHGLDHRSDVVALRVNNCTPPGRNTPSGSTRSEPKFENARMSRRSIEAEMRCPGYPNTSRYLKMQGLDFENRN